MLKEEKARKIAKELYDKYFNFGVSTGVKEKDIDPKDIIGIALITVDEMLKNLKYYQKQYKGEFFEKEISLHKKIRKEIKLLKYLL